MYMYVIYISLSVSIDRCLRKYELELTSAGCHGCPVGNQEII